MKLGFRIKKKQSGLNKLPRCIIPLEGALVLSLLFTSFEASGQITPPGISAAALIEQTVARELAAANASGHYRYRIEEEMTHGSETRDMLESRDWLIGRVILRNGQPLNADEYRREDECLQNLLKNPARLEVFRKEQFSRQERLRRLIAAFPEAFYLEFIGAEQDGSGRKLDRLKFRPNLAFAAPTWEVRTLQGMQGTILIDAVQMRLVRIEAKFFRDVNFGFGILGRIDRGGSFVLEQQGVGCGRWAITQLAFHYNKRTLFMRSHVDSVLKASGFRSLSGELTLEEGIAELLEASQMGDTLKKDR